MVTGHPRSPSMSSNPWLLDNRWQDCSNLSKGDSIANWSVWFLSMIGYRSTRILQSYLFCLVLNCHSLVGWSRCGEGGGKGEGDGLPRRPNSPSDSSWTAPVCQSGMCQWGFPRRCCLVWVVLLVVISKQGREREGNIQSDLISQFNVDATFLHCWCEFVI